MVGERSLLRAGESDADVPQADGHGYGTLSEKKWYKSDWYTMHWGNIVEALENVMFPIKSAKSTDSEILLVPKNGLSGKSR